MSVPSPFEDVAAWDSVTVMLSKAGKAEKFDFADTSVDFDGDVTNDWDVKKPKGADSARTSDEGYVPAKFSMTVLLCKPEHFRTYEALVQAGKPRPGKEPKPVVIIVHPLLQLYALTMCRLEKIRFLDFKEVDQYEAKFDLLEWTPDPPKAAKVQAKQTPASQGITLREVNVYGDARRATKPLVKPAPPSKVVKP